ncbi:hypothetical protein FQA39_LY10157 [Lamprigera yunnana]|nr:hypothetical protein FQA39_LY10157 [Lamprigera yunnana]
MKPNHVHCDIFEELLQGTGLEPYTLVPYKSSTNLDDPFVDEMEIASTCDKTASSMTVCLENYTNGSARDHQISVDNKPTNLDDLFVDEMEIVYHYADRQAPEQQISVEIPDTPPPPIFDGRDQMSVIMARVSKLISSDSTSQNFINLKLRELFILNKRWYNINRLRLEAKRNGVSFSSALTSQLTQLESKRRASVWKLKRHYSIEHNWANHLEKSFLKPFLHHIFRHFLK